MPHERQRTVDAPSFLVVRDRHAERAAAPFDPVVEGARYGLLASQATALWAQVVAALADRAGGYDVDEAARRFHALAVRRVRQPGKQTLVDGTALALGRAVGRVPGRTTQLALEAAAVDVPQVAPSQVAASQVATVPVAGAASALPAASINPHRPLAALPAGGKPRPSMSWLFGAHLRSRPGASEREVARSAAPWLPGFEAAGRGASLPAPVMRSATGPAELDPRAADLIERARHGGTPLDDALRSRLEASLGARLDGVRVHTGPEADAAARAIGARAFAIGDDVMFRDGAYDPHGRDGQRLIAHEVAHTVQAHDASLVGARGVSEPDDAPEREADRFADAFVSAPAAVAMPVARAAAVPEATAGAIFRQKATTGAASHQHAGVSPEVAAAYDAFVDGVYAAADRIVTANEQAVEAWCDYVLVQLPPQQLAGQALATGFVELEAQAKMTGAEHLVAPYANEANPVRQELYEQQIAGAWRACTGCHVSVQASAVDAQMHALHDPGHTPAELLQRHADADNPGSVANPFAGRAPASPGPAAAAGSHIPAARAAGPAAALGSAHESLIKLKPMLQPLGDGGYKILPAHLISRFGTAPIAQLRGELQAAFNRRVSGYESLLAHLRERSIDYLELDSLVKTMQDTVRPEVRALIDADKRLRSKRQIVRFVGMLLVDLLSIVVPPLGLVAGAFHVANGLDQYKVGADRANATGAHQAMSPERQASGPMMQLGGAMEAFGGAVQAGTSAAGLRAKASRPAGASLAARSTRSRVGPFSFEPLENGTIRVTHADFPGKSMILHPDGTLVGLDELGNVVGTIHPDAVHTATAHPATSSATGAPRNAPAPAPKALPAPATPASQAVPTPATAAPSTALAVRPPATAPRQPAITAVPPFHTGGIGAGTFPPNQYNPSGRGDNCGFCGLSAVDKLQQPDGPFRSADDLYNQIRQLLGLPADAPLSRQLVFPQASFDGMAQRPGYEPLFDDNGGNRLSSYTLPNVARALGIPGKEATDVMRRWSFAFGDRPSVEAATEARLQYLEEKTGRSLDSNAVRTWVIRQRIELVGTYLVGTHGSNHYIVMEVHADGSISGGDVQNGAKYSSLSAVQSRMGHEEFDLAYKIEFSSGVNSR